MANYKNPSFRGFYNANIKAEPDWQGLSVDFITDQDVLGRWESWGVLIPCSAPYEIVGVYTFIFFCSPCLLSKLSSLRLSKMWVLMDFFFFTFLEKPLFEEREKELCF